MQIDSSQLVPLLAEFSSLNATQQQVFLFALLHCPRIVRYSSDSGEIARALNIHVRTVQRATAAISRSPILSRCVTVIHFNPQEELKNEYLEKQAAFTAQRDL